MSHTCRDDNDFACDGCHYDTAARRRAELEAEGRPLCTLCECGHLAGEHYHSAHFRLRVDLLGSSSACDVEGCTCPVERPTRNVDEDVLEAYIRDHWGD